ncbi:DivIVA domain-containing protein [[Acholeplasma] multilocale]|uniref:DivIVA domain-containing protein n=1 Tax=[Acholeplasma] multilocale TaxID=264638 RepID=UPI00041855A7|nr:DivIVA domain-containing protein [[Acholeplasma] multilocale]
MKTNKFTSEDIRDANFLTEIKGYKMEQVNDFLDDVQRDYIHFIETINIMKEEIIELRKDKNKSEKEIDDLTNQVQHLRKERHEAVKNELADSNVIQKINRIESAIADIAKKMNK